MSRDGPPSYGGSCLCVGLPVYGAAGVWRIWGAIVVFVCIIGVFAMRYRSVFMHFRYICMNCSGVLVLIGVML